MNPSINMNLGMQGYNVANPNMPPYLNGGQKFPSLEDLKACKIGKRKWTINEDIRLHELVQYYGTDEWVLIANMMQNRNSRQCRERWRTKFNPDILKGEWTSEEDSIILTMYADIGSKWVAIAKNLPGRTESDIRNRFSSLDRAKTKLIEDAAEKTKPVSLVETNNEVKEDANPDDGVEKTDLKSTIASLLEQIDKNNKRKIDPNVASIKKSRKNAPDIRSLYMQQQTQQQQSMMPYQYPATGQNSYNYQNVYPAPSNSAAPQPTADGMIPASAYMQLMQQTQMQQQMIEQMQKQQQQNVASSGGDVTAPGLSPTPRGRK